MDDKHQNYPTNQYALMHEFDSFKFNRGETLSDLIERCWKLIRTMYDNGVETSTVQKVTCLANALPPRWNKVIKKMKETKFILNVGLNEFIRVLDELKAKRPRNAS